MLKQITLAAALVLGTLPVQAAPKWKKTLPLEFYVEQAHQGHYEAGLYWTAPGFEPSRGITWDGVATCRWASGPSPGRRDPTT